MLPSSAQQPPTARVPGSPHFPAAKLRPGHTPCWTWSRDLNPCLPDPRVYALSKLTKALTIFTLWPAVDEMFQVHSFRLGYLSGQLGLIKVPSALLILYAQPAGGQKGTHRGVIQHNSSQCHRGISRSISNVQTYSLDLV